MSKPNKLITALKWLAGFGVLPIVGTILWWSFGQPSFTEVQRYLQSFRIEQAEGTQFTVLVADLEGDSDFTQTNLLAEALEEAGGLGVIRKGRVLAASDPGSVAKAREKAEKTGRDWLADHKANVLLWGRVAGSYLKVRFLSRKEGMGSRLESAPQFGEEITLPQNFEKALREAQLVAVALSQIEPATNEQGEYLVSRLRPVAMELKKLLEKRAAALPSEQKASLHFSLGLAASTVGEQAGESEWLEQAVIAYHAALEEHTSERVSSTLVVTTHSMGKAFGSLSEREGDLAQMKSAPGVSSAASGGDKAEKADYFVSMVKGNLRSVEELLVEMRK